MMLCNRISRLNTSRCFYEIKRVFFVKLFVTMAEAPDETTEITKRKQFGNRYLTDQKNVFEHNAWDNVVWDEDQEREARQKTEEQLAHPASLEDQEKYETDASENWNKFYNKHENRFFKDRHWLFTEFPELAPESYLSEDRLSELSKTGNQEQKSENSVINSTSPEDSSEKQSDSPSLHNLSVNDMPEEVCDTTGSVEAFPGESSTYRIFEVGCGVGNTVFPILQANNDPRLMVYCSDFSSTAVDLVKDNKDYNKKRCHAFVCDISDPDSVVPFPDGSLDVIILIFVLSAIRPEKFEFVLKRLAGFLKPGGVILFRDYGRYDLAQLRFKKGRCLSENFYARGDGTRVYFFTQEDLRELMTKAGLLEKQNFIDRRLQVNRGRQLKMYRVWIQCKYTKPTDDQSKSTQAVET